MQSNKWHISSNNISSSMDTNKNMIKTDMNNALFILPSKVLDCYSVSCLIKTKMFSLKVENKPRVNAVIIRSKLKRQTYAVCTENLVVILSEPQYKSFGNLLNIHSELQKVNNMANTIGITSKAKNKLVHIY